MRLTSSLAYSRAAPVPKMPPGLVELMEGLTKDVLKNNPSNVYEFCANHLEKLLEMRDGPLPVKSQTLEEKIAKAQEKVRHRAKERQQRFDNDEQRDLKHVAPENVDSGKVAKATEKELLLDLRAPVHHDQELSHSSEVEISHEPTDNNSLTSKDSNFDESDEITISKSSTLSSVSRSTVIDLMAVNDHETNNKEDIDDGIENIVIPKDETVELTKVIKERKDENIAIPKIQINNDEKAEENEVVKDQKDENIEKPKTEINKDELAGKIEVPNDKKDEAAKDTITELSSDSSINKIQENFELVTQVDKGESAVIIQKENLVKEVYNTLEVQPDDLVKRDIDSDHEIELKSLNEVNAIIEEDENMDTEIERSNEIKTEEVKENVIKITDDNIINDNRNELMSTADVDNEKLENKQVTDIDLTITDTAESLNKTIQPEIIIEIANNVTDDQTKDLNSDDRSKKTEIPNDIVQASVFEFDKEKIPRPDSKDDYNEGNESDDVDLNIYTDEKKDVYENKSNEDSSKTLLNLTNDRNNSDDLDKTFPEDEEKFNKEDNANSSSTSFQRLGDAENNGDGSVIGSDLSKSEDDIKSDTENGQNNMDLETAAETIQKVFRSFLFKSRNSTFEDITNDDATSLDEENDKNKEEYYATANLNKERRPLGITRMDTVLQTVNEEKSLSLSTDDSSTTLSSAATTIQAHVRGFLVRNRLNSYKTVSTNSLVNSNEILDTDNEQQKNKTVLNIHIVPEEGNYLSRDESLITSMDLSLDESPPSSINLHPLSYDLVSERRKLLKREDAIQSVSPPSNNSGKLSEDSVKEVLNENDASKTESNTNEKDQPNPENNSPETLVTADNTVAVRNISDEQDSEIVAKKRKKSMSSDESDVVTPFTASPRSLVGDYENTSKLIHSGEFHDVVLPTKVSRSDTTVVSEFKNVLAYILLWNNS